MQDLGCFVGPCFRSAQPARCLQPLARQQKRATRFPVTIQAARQVVSVQAAKVGNSYRYVCLTKVFTWLCCRRSSCHCDCPCSKVFDSSEAQADLRFVELLDGQNKILVVTAVAPGSSAEKVSLQHCYPLSVPEYVSKI